MYCFDTDVLSASLRPSPPLALLRRLARVPPQEQSTTAISAGELLYGAAKRGGRELSDRVRAVLRRTQVVFPFDMGAAEVYASLRVALEAQGRRLDEPDLRIASIALSRDLTLVTGNVRHFSRVPGLRIENWLKPEPLDFRPLTTP